MAAFTLVDHLMKETPGYSHRFTRALGSVGANIEVKMTSQISITIAIKKQHIKKAAIALAKEFNLAS